MESNTGKIKVLLLENVSLNAQTIFEEAGFEVEMLKQSLSKEELIQKIAPFNIVGVRSKSKLDADVLAAATNLEAIGCYCIGTDQTDTKKASLKGIPVFNSPFCNSRSVAELIISQIISLSRKIGDQNMSMHQGEWIKSGSGCYEVRGKTVGIIGYGHIGSQLSVLSESLGMKVLYYDVANVLSLGNSSRRPSLDQLLLESDFVTLHVPLTKQTENMIGAKELSIMKEGSYVLNASRGNVVDLDALAKALKSGHIGGAYVDVYPVEPEKNCKDFKNVLQGCPNTILTPHIGGSTEEAQTAIADEVSRKLVEFVLNGKTIESVNFPEVAMEATPGCHRLLSIHQNKPGYMKKMNLIVNNYNFNISEQVLRTKDSVGICLVDIEKERTSEDQVLEISREEILAFEREVALIENGIKTKVLF